MDPEFIFYTGSRSGSLAALAIFACVFGVLGYGVARECWRRGLGVRSASGVGVTLFIVLLALFYVSSIGGFYEVRGYATHVETRALVPQLSSKHVWRDVARVETQPAFKGRWRLILVNAAGDPEPSATAERHVVEAAAAAVRHRLADRQWPQ
jgi:hypothetical protein